MARIATTLLGLGTWGYRENPGAGTQDLTAIGTGLNDNWKIIDTALGTGHNTNGTHKADVIDGPSLKTTVADGSTLELAGSPLKLRIKDLGVTTAKLNDLAVTGAKIANATIAEAKLDAALQAKLVTRTVARTLYNNAKEAGTAAGNTPAAFTEWGETSASAVKKISFWFVKKPGETTMKLVALLKGSAGGVTARGQLEVGGSLVYAQVTGTTYDVGNCAVDISALIDDLEYQVDVSLSMTAGAGTAYLKVLEIVVT